MAVAGWVRDVPPPVLADLYLRDGGRVGSAAVSAGRPDSEVNQRHLLAALVGRTAPSSARRGPSATGDNEGGTPPRCSQAGWPGCASPPGGRISSSWSIRSPRSHAPRIVLVPSPGIRPAGSTARQRPRWWRKDHGFGVRRLEPLPAHHRIDVTRT